MLGAVIMLAVERSSLTIGELLDGVKQTKPSEMMHEYGLRFYNSVIGDLDPTSTSEALNGLKKSLRNMIDDTCTCDTCKDRRDNGEETENGPTHADKSIDDIIAESKNEPDISPQTDGDEG